MNTPKTPTHTFSSGNTPSTPLHRTSSKLDPHPHTFTEDDLHDIHAKLRVRPDASALTEFDYEAAVRNTYYGRRLYPTYDPSHMHACPLRFIRQFEHTAQHNGLPVKAWARRMNACLHGKAEDWAFDEAPLEVSGTAWDVRKRQFLDWALLPAEQEVRRQRLLRFFQAEGDLSSEFVAAFEDTARGLRDYREDLWVRKCVANMLSGVRGALVEMFPEAMPVRFRDLRDALYAADWDLYEAASAPLKVARIGHILHHQDGYHLPNIPSIPSRTSTSSSSAAAAAAARLSVASYSRSPIPGSSAAKVRRQARASMAASPQALRNSLQQQQQQQQPTSLEPSQGSSSKAAGISDLVCTLSRLSEKERTIVMVALERMSFIDEVVGSDAHRLSNNRLAQALSPTTPRPSTSPRVSSARAHHTTPLGSRNTTSTESSLKYGDISSESTSPGQPPPAPKPSATSSGGSGGSGGSGSGGGGGGGGGTSKAAAKIRLRTRPMTSMESSRSSSQPSGQFSGRSSEALHAATTSSHDKSLARVGTVHEKPLRHHRELSSRRSDSALTTATRSIRVDDSVFYRESADVDIKSPEFTVLQQNIAPHARRDRFRFIRKISNILSH